jgi:hypothetical protein
MERLDELRPAERLAALGAAVVAGSLLLPWYGIELELFGGFSQTGLEAFNPAHAALLVAAAATVVLLWAGAGGRRLPRPLEEGALLVLAGAWMAVLVGYLAIDRPDAIAGFDGVRLRYGLFVALGGAAAVAVAGVRTRQASSGRPSGAWFRPSRVRETE